MPLLRPASSSSSDSDSDVPETVSLSQSKKSIQKHNADIHQAKALAREKRKLKNRAKDQKLKERAAKNRKDETICPKKEKKKRIVEDYDNEEEQSEGSTRGPLSDVEARMLRAMEDAEREESLDGEGEDSEDPTELQEDSGSDDVDVDPTSPGSGDSEEQESSVEMDSGSEDYGNGTEDEDEEMVSDDERGLSAKSPLLGKSLNYLPDEIFKAASTQASKPPPSRSKKSDLSNNELKKRKRSSTTPKDLIVGTKAIRTLASPATPVSSRAAVPTAKVKKFLDRTLALKGQKRTAAKTWERRPANIGILRRNGPAAHFVRSR